MTMQRKQFRQFVIRACDSNDKHIEIEIGVFMRDDSIELIYEHANERTIYDVDEYVDT